MVNYFLYVLIHCSVITSSLKYCNGCLPRTQHPSGKHSSSACNNCPFKKLCKLRAWALPARQLVLHPGPWSMYNALQQISPRYGLSSPKATHVHMWEWSFGLMWASEGWHIAAKAVCKPVCVWTGKDVNELGPREMGGLGISTRCQKAPLGQKHGNQFFHTELKLILIADKFISQFSCNLKRTLKVHSIGYSENHCWAREYIPRYLARHV